MKFTHRFYTIIAIISVHLGSPSYAGIVNDGSKAPIDAAQLATDFSQDKPTADAQYRGKQVAIKGVICKIEKGFGSTDRTLACIYLQTAAGLPYIKVELANIDNALDQAGRNQKNRIQVIGSHLTVQTKSRVDVRITDNTLEAKIAVTRTNSSDTPIGRFNRTTRESGEWQAIAKCGDTVVATGVCKGKLVDIVISDASL